MNIQVIGGGIAGASIGYHLAKAGATVTVYDRADAGQATDVSAGIICPWVSQRRNKAWYQLVREGAKYYPAFINELEVLTNKSTGYQQTGAVLLFKDEKTQQLAYERIKMKHEDAPEMGELTLLTKEQLQQIWPSLTTEYFGHHLSGGALVNGATLRDALKEGLEKLGSKWIKSGTQFSKDYDVRIYTGGAWGNELQRTVPVSHQKAQLLHFTMDMNQQLPVIMGLKTHYIISFGGGQFAIGTTHEDTDSFDVTPSEEAIRELKELAKSYFPNQQLRGFRTAIGLRPYTPNHLPVVQQIEEKTWVINGLGSSGLTSAPIIGRELAAYLMKQPTEIDLTYYQVGGE
ncbi:NAD(P)/FAD-dependent oxidoreductase [Chryseomicrobium palamuruense]|uniref:NAD(P)/FAD-dependent oxidoreductase n=1 Tax=Chryseomicrobium palamuruense TaxID=682973 RepID=A0ABV8UYC2_9BACL